MDRRHFISRCAVGALGIPFCGHLLGGAAALASDVKAARHWGYSGPAGPTHWGSLSTDFAICGSGSQQSPVNLDPAGVIPAKVGHIQLAYKTMPLRLVNNGHTIQVNCAPGSTLTLRGHSYDLLQFHFHAPSEHTREGKHFDMELHLVHQSATHDIAVLGVLLKEGAQNPTLYPIWSHLPSQAGPEMTVPGTSIDASRLVPASRAYYTYMGSLTTPPCTEGVRWVVLAEPSSVSRAQIDRFIGIIGKNARPVQSLDHRFVLEQL